MSVSNNVATIDGRAYKIPRNANVSMVNGTVLVNGKDVRTLGEQHQRTVAERGEWIVRLDPILCEVYNPVGKIDVTFGQFQSEVHEAVAVKTEAPAVPVAAEVSQDEEHETIITISYETFSPNVLNDLKARCVMTDPVFQIFESEDWRANVKVTTPTRHLVVQAQEGITATGETNTVRLCSATGDVTVRDLTVSKCNVNTTSGEVTVRRSTGTFETDSASGDVTLEECTVEKRSAFKSMSGDVEFTGCTLMDDIHVKTMSGDVTMESCRLENDVEIRTMSGDVRIKTTNKVKFEAKSMSGRCKITNGEGPRLPVVTAATMSGDVRAVSG